MPKNSKFKREVRARKERTGESYMQSREALLASANGDSPTEPLGIRGQIQAVLNAQPDLSYLGFRTWFPRRNNRAEDVAKESAEFKDNRNYMLSDDVVQQIEACLNYLALVRKTRTAKPKGDSNYPSSYGMKHEVQAWCTAAGKKDEGAYIANGAFIVAALIAGFPIHREDIQSPNCAVGVEREDTRAVREGKDPREWRKTTTFVKWLFAQAGREDPVGDLARDCKVDFKFPRQGNVTEIRSYLSHYGNHVQEAFAEAHLEYQNHPQKVQPDAMPKEKMTYLEKDGFWRNLLILGINEGLRQKIFGLGANENFWPTPNNGHNNNATYSWTRNGRSLVAQVRDIGYGELSVVVLVEPTPKGLEEVMWVSHRPASEWRKRARAVAFGWLERQKGPHIMGFTKDKAKHLCFLPPDSIPLLRELGEEAVAGYAREGKFYL